MSRFTLITGVTLFLAFPVFSLNVVTTRRGSVFLEASPDSGVLRKFEAGERLRALAKGGKSAKGWIQVEAEGETGWVQRSQIEAESSEAAKKRKSENELDDIVTGDEDLNASQQAIDDAELSNDPLLSKYNKTLDKIVAVRKGRLFEQPSKFSERFGIVEAGDELTVLKRKGPWTHVRLKLTSEEGWYPEAHIKVIRQKRLGSIGPNSLEAEVGSATKGYHSSFGGGYFYNFLDHENSRNRLEFGVVGTYFFGETLAEGIATLKSQFTSILFAGRYTVTGSDGYFSGGGELAAGYLKATITNSGISQDIVESKGLDEDPSGVRITAGIFGGWNFTEHMTGALGARAFVLGDFVANTYLGLKVRF